MTTEKMEIWKEVFADEEFSKKLLALDASDALAILQEKGYSLTAADMDEMATAINTYKEKITENGELSEEDLQKIAGGGFWDHVGSFVAGVVGGLIYYTVNVPW